jgi:hypothetical protein
MDNSHLSSGFDENSKSSRFVDQIKKISSSQKISVLAIAALAVIMPVAIIGLMNAKSVLRPKANPLTPPTPTQAASVFGSAVYLNGDSYIEASNSSSINPTLGFTVEAWIKPEALINDANIISKMSGSQNSFRIFMHSEQLYGTNDYQVVYNFGVVNSGNNCILHSVEKQMIYTGNDIAKITSWQHIAGVVDIQGNMQIYVNGQKSTSNSNRITGVCDRTLPVIVGARVLNSTSVDGYFNGLIDEIRISNTARYFDNFNPLLNPFLTDTNTTILYHLNGDLLNSSRTVTSYDGIAHNNISYKISDIVAVPTITIAPTQTPTPEPTLSPIPYSIVIPNSATNKTCSEICDIYALSCTSVGTDSKAENSKSWSISRSACSETSATCSTLMKKTAKRVCSGYQSPGPIANVLNRHFNL